MTRHNTKNTDEVRRRRRSLAGAGPAEKKCKVCGATHYDRNRSTCSDECWRDATTRRADWNADDPLTNDFLPWDAEENLLRIPVPSPSEIVRLCREVREPIGMLWDASDLS